VSILGIFTLIGLAQGSILQGTKLLALALVLAAGVPGAFALTHWMVASHGAVEGVTLITSLAIIAGLLYMSGILIGQAIHRRNYSGDRKPGGWYRLFGGLFGLGEGIILCYLALTVLSILPGVSFRIGDRTLAEARDESKLVRTVFRHKYLPRIEPVAKLEEIEQISSLAYRLERLNEEVHQTSRQSSSTEGQSPEQQSFSLTQTFARLEQKVPQVHAFRDKDLRERIKQHVRRGELFSALDIPEVKALLNDPATQKLLVQELNNECQQRVDEIKRLKTGQGKENKGS
jgi:hypothetical protein